MVSALIEEIVTHYTAIAEARTKLVDLLENALDGEVNFDFTWLYVKAWSLKEGDGCLRRASIEYATKHRIPVNEVWRNIHPDYVFVLSDRDDAGQTDTFIAILRAANEEKGA